MSPRNEPQTCALRLGNSEYYQHETARRSSEGLAMNNRVRIQSLEDNASDAELNKAMISARWTGCELVLVLTEHDLTETPGLSGQE